MSEYCVELNHITKRFGKFTAVDDVNLKLLPGKVYGFVGPNGAGKSTTMGMIMGSLIPSEGDGNIMGHPLASKEALRLLGYSPEFTSFYGDMSCVEYLWYMAKLAGIEENEAFAKAKMLIEKFGLSDHAFDKVAKFSTGMKKKVSLAQAMIHDPKVLLLDEPTANLDPTSRMEILNTVREMVAERNLTVIISSHVLTELETVIDHVIMINGGKIIMDDEIAVAKDRFAHGNILVSTSDNNLLIEKMDPSIRHEVLGKEVRFSGKDMNGLKKMIVKVIYENDLQLDMLQQESLSLDSVYKQAMEGEENETDIH